MNGKIKNTVKNQTFKNGFSEQYSIDRSAYPAFTHFEIHFGVYKKSLPNQALNGKNIIATLYSQATPRDLTKIQLGFYPSVTQWKYREGLVASPRDNGKINNVIHVAPVLPLLVATAPNYLMDGQDRTSHKGMRFDAPWHDPSVNDMSEQQCIESFKQMFERVKLALLPAHYDMRGVIDALRDRFLTNKNYESAPFVNGVLNKTMATDKNFTSYRNRVIWGVIKVFKQNIHWKINEFKKGNVFKSKNQNKKDNNGTPIKLSNPAFAEKPYNIFNGLLICIDTVAWAEVHLTEYAPPDESGHCKMKFKFELWDNFGFDDEDVRKYGERKGLAWFYESEGTLLQHAVALRASGRFKNLEPLPRNSALLIMLNSLPQL
nr:DUF3289 family protein [Hydromonas duriensis]